MAEKGIMAWGRRNSMLIIAASVGVGVGIMAWQAGAFAGFGYAPFSAGGAGEGLGTGGLPVSDGGTGEIGTVCTVAATVAESAYYDDYTSGVATPTRVATSAALYRDSDAIAMNTSTTSTGQDVELANTVRCGKEFHIIYGDDDAAGGHDYYFADTGLLTADSPTTPAPLKLKEEGTVTITVQNKTTFGASQVGVDIATGTPNSDVKFFIDATSANTYWGDTKYGISVGSASANWTTFQVASLDGFLVTPIECHSNVTNYFAAASNVKCFEVTPTGTEMLNTKGTFTHSFRLTATPIGAPSAGAANITLGTFDYAGRIKNGAVLPGYYNTENSQDMGAANVYLDNAIVPY